MSAARRVRGEQAMRELGRALGAALEPGCVIHLAGELGAGKTTLARALIQARLPGARVRSPTYTLVESYPLAGFTIHHLDLYRIADPAELDALGVRDLAGGGDVVLIEWPERGGAATPPADLRLRLEHAGDARDVGVEGLSERGRRMATALGFEPASSVGATHGGQAPT